MEEAQRWGASSILEEPAAGLGVTFCAVQDGPCGLDAPVLSGGAAGMDSKRLDPSWTCRAVAARLGQSSSSSERQSRLGTEERTLSKVCSASSWSPSAHGA